MKKLTKAEIKLTMVDMFDELCCNYVDLVDRHGDPKALFTKEDRDKLESYNAIMIIIHKFNKSMKL